MKLNFKFDFNCGVSVLGFMDDDYGDFSGNYGNGYGGFGFGGGGFGGSMGKT